VEDAVTGERILVVDDSSQIRATLRRMILEPEGYEVLTASDGQAGLDTALRERPDLVLLDVNMPRLTGLQVLEALHRARYEWPVILMTSHGSEQVAVEALRLGVRDYIPKPFEVQDVLARVQRALVESKLRRERADLTRRLEAANARLSRQVSDLTVLQALGQAVTSLLDTENMLGRVVEGAVYLCRADEGVLYVVDPDTGELYMMAAQSAGQKAAQGLRLRVIDRLVNRVVETGEPILLTSKMLSSAQLRVQTGYLVYSLLSVPLKTRGRTIGVLCVVNKGRLQDFSQDDVGRLRAVASYAAIAVENSQLVEATRKDAVADMLDKTVATVAHYINNPLMSLMVKADGLVLAKQRGALVEATDAPGEPGQVEELARFTERKVQEIKAVLTILSDLTSPQIVTHMDDVKMLDIDARVRDRLRRIQAQYEA
jgi:two-component system NtrC family sensor kinase